MKAVGITLSVVYLLVLAPVLFFGWVAYSDYGYRGCPSEAIGQCSDAETMMGFAIAYLAVGFALLVILRRKGATNA